MRKNNRICVIIHYTVKYDVSTEYDWSKEVGTFDHYESVQERFSMQTFPKHNSFGEDYTKESAIETFKKMIARDVRENSPTKNVAIRWDKVI